MSSERYASDSDSGSSSSVSITSTRASSENADSEYPIKELLADKYCEDRRKHVYLVHWDGWVVIGRLWVRVRNADLLRSVTTSRAPLGSPSNPSRVTRSRLSAIIYAKRRPTRLSISTGKSGTETARARSSRRSLARVSGIGSGFGWASHSQRELSWKETGVLIGLRRQATSWKGSSSATTRG